MNIDIDISDIYFYTGRMQDIADELDTILQEMNYFYNGSAVMSQGEFSAQYEHMGSIIQSTTSDVRNFIRTYACLIQSVAENYDILDEQMADMVVEYLKNVRK